MAGGKNYDLMMFKNIVLVVSVLGTLHSAVGQLIQNGQCNTINLVPSFDINQFEGLWYELSRTANPVENGDCSFFQFNVTDDEISVYNSAVNANFFEDRNGTATLANGTAMLTLNLTSPNDPFNFWILDVNYNFFTIAFNCEDLSLTQRQVNIWVLSRLPAFPNDMIPALINQGLNNAFGVTMDNLRSVDQSADACYILPIIEPGEPIILPGQCNDTIAVQQNFQPQDFTGVWHEIYSYVSGNSQNLCSRAEYTLEGGVVLVENSQVVNQTLFSIFGNATVVSNDGSAQLSVVLVFGNGVTVTQELKVIATDYQNYAVSYSCEDLPENQKRVYSWVLGRSRQLTPEVQAAVNRVIDSELVLNNAYYRQTDQSDEACFFFPEPELNKPVVFRGLCETNIPAIPNFDPVRYQGIWHDIESYPSVFQTGTCRNANYVLGPGGVDVLNTQVINQTLDTMPGVAVLASVDGSGMLNVTFNVSGIEVTTNYWVLDTDYDSYSMVYSCVNINEDERQVWSWKLSRFKFLTENATIAINNAISNITVLDQRYYQPVDQSEEGCFFFPTPQLGVPVVFPGYCEDINVVPNFSLTQFEGTWHEIETYPKDQVQGQCINHQYSTGAGDTLNLQTSQITDQFLSLSNGTLSFTSTDNSARLTINITSDGEQISIPFWILSVNYTDYALAYSCVDINTDFRAVYSWKLSRTRELSQDARTNIDSAIAGVTVLAQEYYEPVDQSDEACFFLPELAPGEPIILVGQCENITVVQNFNASRYLGRWHLIESYGTEFQGGTCNQATYSSGADGTVDVFNTQVIDQTLNTITGSASVASTDGSGILSVIFPNSPVPAPYWILDTDYDSYALVYSCRNINDEQRRVWSWKLSRTPSLTDEARTEINRVVDSVNVLNNRFYYEIDRSAQACFYFPEADENTPPRFRGRCGNVTAIPNFNAVAYQGTWHTIELYPSRTQSGTCSNANYNLVNGEIIVRNRDVRNQILNSLFGVAASVDGSGQLEVILEVGGRNRTRTLYVLDTDYDTYSLAYACNEVDDEYIQISSWKLSRTKQLPAPAVISINNTINSIQVLDERYYWPMDQSAEGCFYFPGPQLGVPVRFTGRCDANVTVVPNFNMTAFQGVWHEISAYPLGEDLGQCINHEYTQAATGLDLSFATVSNLTLNIAGGNLTFAQNNNVNDGRLVANVPFYGSLVQIPFWILDVDYEDYALAYGCVDQVPVDDQDYRIVYSWKLSRSRQPSQAALAAYNQTIDTVDVLREEYYEDVDQSDEACFHLPEFVPGQVQTFPGQCDNNITVVSSFNASAYLGRWFLIESYPTPFQSGTCNDATYSPGAGGSVDVFNTQVVNQELATILGSAVLASTDDSGKLLVTFPNAPPSEYWILDTDYQSYALVYSCRNINNDQRNVWSWKLSRTRSLSPEANNNINEIVNSINVLNDRYYVQVDHSPSGCFFFPDPDPNTQVRFRGRCGDDDITPVAEFSAVDYLDLWHLIESYPTPFQGGTCNNALYTLGADGVDVFNTQVINQTLDTMTGLAVVASLDGSGILNVSFPIAGTDETISTPYWVLATDYVSYSMVYTCVEIDEEFKQVWSWKLSRSKELTPTAIESINNVTRNHQVLDDRYYVDVDQSPEGCFYFPEPQLGVPVVFPGQCANISVEQNFNLTLFQGIWHEIETYPKEQVSGQCINHEYSAGVGNTLDLLSSQVFDQTLNVNNGTLSFTSDDGSARLEITITVNGSDFTIPFWIIDTDYEDYALAYSCVNQGSDYRGVFSWKLSRSRTLSNAGNIAINNAITNVDVLDNIYYEPVDQSPDACFHLPDLAPGEPVILPGECDLNLPVVQNFNASRYLGRWRLISSYATEFQSGACNEANYSPNAAGVEVFNTQVINQTLATITGSAVVASTDGSGKLLVTFPNSPEPSTYWILDTDYEDYALVYSCRNVGSEQRRVYAWILSRERVLSPEATIAIDRVVNNTNVLDYRYFEDVEHSDDACFYFPPPDGRPVVFRGQCAVNVTTVANFDPEAYTGIWYDIESYPQNFQNGTCPTADYTLGANGVVSVVNTQVVAQELDTIVGTAVLAGSDTSATLIVTFPIAGTGLTINTPYYILATDYYNYSLVYSCENIDEESRRVSSWKLSRAQNLSDASVAAISEAMEQLPVLQEQYFEYRGHSEEDCFFYPDNEGGPVILEGQCPQPDEVNTVTNFNAELFSGQWHEVSRFPSELQTGECSATDFDFAFNSFTQTIVADEELTTVSGQATVAPGGNGIISVSLSDAIGTVNINNTLYVLDVEYDSFALLYSCRNINNSNIQVYSWKLSRSRAGLNQSAIDRINAIVSSEANLFAGYYEETQQDNNACFHYPDFEELPDAIQLTGPCDESIRGVDNFEAGRYINRWFEIERYPQRFQTGACNRAVYTPSSVGVDVFNSQVVNRTLRTISGSAILVGQNGTGELVVTFDVNGVTNIANYYVLATDYDSYSLVYSCRNTADGNNRIVASWKLSRTTELSDAANAAIDAVVNTTQGLRQDYYQPTAQTPEACFYVPEFDATKAPLFRGTCAGITGMQNFNLNNFVQYWNNVDTYPEDSPVGSCISSHFQQSGGVVTFTDTSVFGLRGEVRTGTVQAFDGGRLRKTYSDGTFEDIWVLQTDYNEFALMLSCETVDEEYVRIWSAKYSTSTTLSPAANQTIAALIEPNDFLHEHFYMTVGHDIGSCFFLPIPNGERVVLPGRCDSDGVIPTQADFDLTAYTGDWYQIERYPYAEVGNTTCIGTRYTLENNASVSVLNWEVDDGTLNTIEGRATVDAGRAILTFELDYPANVTQPAMYILQTDYIDYALAYTCEDLNEYQRTVVAFKLSRHRTLSDEANTAINNFMNTRRELDNQYFIPVEQDEDCEEPSSSYLVRSSIVVLLICYALHMLA